MRDFEIQGCKMSETRIVYTPWENLKKTADMVVGQIGYHNSKRTKYITVKKNHDIVKKIEKTRTEDMKPDFAAERLKRDEEVLSQEKAAAKKAAEEAKDFKLVSFLFNKFDFKDPLTIEFEINYL